MTLRTLAATLTTTALIAGGAASAVAQTSTDSSSSRTSTSAGRTARPGPGGPPRRSDEQRTRVASALGTDAAGLAAAEAKVRAATKATAVRETRAQEDALLATELGRTAAQVKAAFAAVRPAGGPRGDCPAEPSASTGSTDATGSSSTDTAS